MENRELYHWGIKGQKWGQRRYQNKDGSLTPAGQKRYNKEVEKLKAETAKVKAAEKAIANRKKVQNKFDKLEEKKTALEERKKALKEGRDLNEEKKKAEEVAKETIEQKRERLLKSSNAKELYDNRDLLTTQELNDRINRIDTEARLSSKIVMEKELTGQEKLKEMQSKLDSVTATYRSIDNAYSTLVNSTIGKTMAKKLGLEPPKEEFDAANFLKNINKKSNQEVQDFKNRLANTKQAKKLYEEYAADEKAKKEAEKAEKEAKEAEKKAEKEAKEAAKRQKKAQKQVDEYNKRREKDNADDSVTSKSYDPDGTYGQKNTDASGRRRGDDNFREYTKKLAIEQKPTKWTDYDDADIIEPDWYKRYKAIGTNTASSVDSSTRSAGQTYVNNNSNKSVNTSTSYNWDSAKANNDSLLKRVLSDYDD